MPGPLVSFEGDEEIGVLFCGGMPRISMRTRWKPEDDERSYIVLSSCVHDYVCSEKHILPLYKRWKVSGFRANLLAKQALVTYTEV